MSLAPRVPPAEPADFDRSRSGARPIDPPAVVVGAGPAGLMAAEQLALRGHRVHLYEAMGSAGRKFLMAGRGGLNLTHSEPLERLLDRYGSAAVPLAPIIRSFGPDAVRAWAAALGITTFVGSSGRIFPDGLKASPLLRAWLVRLGRLGVVLHTRHRWQGFAADGGLDFIDDAGQPQCVRAPAIVLALGGASWARLGSDGTWAAVLGAAGLQLTPFRPSNCGFTVDWPLPFRLRYAGQPLKNIALCAGEGWVRGEAMITADGIEGGAVYALGAAPHRHLAAEGATSLRIDLKPDLSVDALARRLDRPRRGASLTGFLGKAAHLSPTQAALARAVLPAAATQSAGSLAAGLKALPIRLTGTAPIDRAISTAGGVTWEALSPALESRARPGLFLAGEMLDWDAPTGGYLLQACLSTGHWAGAAVADRLDRLKFNRL